MKLQPLTLTTSFALTYHNTSIVWVLTYVKHPPMNLNFHGFYLSHEFFSWKVICGDLFSRPRTECDGSRVAVMKTHVSLLVDKWLGHPAAHFKALSLLHNQCPFQSNLFHTNQKNPSSSATTQNRPESIFFGLGTLNIYISETVGLIIHCHSVWKQHLICTIKIIMFYTWFLSLTTLGIVILQQQSHIMMLENWSDYCAKTELQNELQGSSIMYLQGEKLEFS